MAQPTGFSFQVRKNGDVVISHHDRAATVLRGDSATKFLALVKTSDPQQLMAKITGNYKRGNERRG